MKLYVIKIANEGDRLSGVLKEALADLEVEIVDNEFAFKDLLETGKFQNARLLFAVSLDKTGISLEAFKLLKYLSLPDCSMQGSVGGVIIDGMGELYTKDLARRITFEANLAGCTFPGKPLVEATANLSNFKVLAGLWNVDLKDAYVKACEALADKILNFEEETVEYPSILMIHASSRKTSNSLCLWSKVAKHLEGKSDIQEVSIRNGEIWDCRGCKYETCVHFGENSSCFYGGVMVEKVYPAIKKCDILVLVCPNYNDAVSANIMAFINRLTSIFRTTDFSKKKIYALVVSGYSGGDIVAQQIIGAINMNKNFTLPGGFALIETANAPGDIEKIPGIDERTREFADKILRKK
ncbi:MAG: flavodoxin family protein [Firmicutes bacterium]|nr:flavodoxin family protein [Bacillota bacterium]